MTDINKLCDELEALLKEATPEPWNLLDNGTISDSIGAALVNRKNKILVVRLRNAAQPLIDAARESVRLRTKLVTGFYGDNVPTFRQGTPEHELEDLVTADECAGYIKQISELRAELEKAQAERDNASGNYLALLSDMEDAQKAILEIERMRPVVEAAVNPLKTADDLMAAVKAYEYKNKL